MVSEKSRFSLIVFILFTISILRITITADGAVFDPNDAVNIKSFGAIGDGVTDDTAAFQAALNSAMSYGHAILIPGGATIRVTATLIYMPSSSKHGPRIMGQGQGKSKILFDFHDGQPLFKIWNRTNARYIYAVCFEGLEIYATSGSQDSQGAVFSLGGCFYWNIDDCYVHDVYGDVVTVPNRTDEPDFSNPDASESAGGLINRCRFEYVDGYGFAGRNSVSASVRITRSYLAQCAAGAVLSGGAGLYVNDNLFALNGKKDSAFNPTILIQRQLNATGQRFGITGNDFQGSAGPHICLNSGQLGKIALNRFESVPNPAWGAGSFPTIGIDFDPVGFTTDLCIDVDNNYVRKSTTDPFTFADFHNSGQVGVIRLRDTMWAGNLTNLTKFANIPTGIEIIDRAAERLHEAVTLIGPPDGSTFDSNGVILSCVPMENVTGYQLLFGAEPNNVMDYLIISDTCTPPSNIITTLPLDVTWWTVKAYDQFGSVIYATPRSLLAGNAIPWVVNLTSGEKYFFIQPAIDNANDGDQIVVNPRVYHENIDFKGKKIMLRSKEPNNPDIVADTIINGDSNSPVVTFSNGEKQNCVIAGFTITDGNSAVYCSGSSPTISNCIIHSNTSKYGGGIYCEDGDPCIVGCAITDNIAEYGGGIYSTGSRYPVISNCTISRNTAVWHGGALNNCDGTINNCVISQNDAQIGGGLMGCGGKIKSCMVTDNTAGRAGGLIACNGIITNCTIAGNISENTTFASALDNCSAEVTNCVIWQNSIPQISGSPVITYSNIEGSWPGQGNIISDPCFVDLDANDFHLRWSSLCIDAGDPSFVFDANERDIDGEPRMMAGRVDMGADEVSQKQADFTRNGIINFEDFSILAHSWFSTDAKPNWNILCDLREDGYIDFKDLAKMLQEWLWQADWYSL
ncbi:MAG: right-handed parallel beta-helix repeat-containing protein [Sedimentisphaerales bacterium]|nr:right-handed parallel beta-helix repeat-containing protein [Sedimentisphaerales bacterium]